YELATEKDNRFSVFIDADVSLSSKAVIRIKRLAAKLSESDTGFGLKLWARFYGHPTFRGMDIYRTKYLQEAIMHIPKNGQQLRPESFIKEKMKNKGHRWRNDISFYVAGLHDFYQYPSDIYYKFLIRSKRSSSDLRKLQSIFQSAPS